MRNSQQKNDDLLDRAVEALCRVPISQDPPPETVARTVEAIFNACESSTNAATNPQRIKIMKNVFKIAVAASILAVVGIVVAWAIFGGSTNIAFAEVARALDSIRTATYDCTMEMKNPADGKMNTTTMKCFFLAPSCERTEMSMSTGSAKDKSSGVMILDRHAMKGLTLVPEQKLATTVDLSKIKMPTGSSTPFEMARQLVREGSSSPGEKFEPLGKKEIDGRVAVGFRIRNNMADETFWADPQTARLVRVDIDMHSPEGHGVINNFRYDMELDPALFSLEPPAGYTVQTQTVAMPVEADLVNVLRIVAEHNNSTFPAAIGNNKAFMRAIQAVTEPEVQKLLKKPETQKLMNKLRAQYGKDNAGFMKAWMKEWMKIVGPITQELTQKYTQGMMFYGMLTSANDSHYVGGGVKLGTPDRVLLWYKPTGVEKYRVIYADLSVKEMTPDEVKKLPKASVK